MKKLTSLILTCVMTLSLTACGGGGTSTSTPDVPGELSGSGGGNDQETITLKLSDCHSPTATNHLAMQRIAEEVATQTNGRIQIEVYPSSQLGDVKPSMEAIQMNTLDMAISNQAVLGTVIPELAVLGAPFMFETDDHIANALNGELGEKLNELAQEKGITIACYLPTGFRHVFSTVPVRTIDDFKSIKIRTMENPLDMATFNALGAIATPMGYNELFTAMQQNTVNAGENALSNIATDGFTEVAKYVTLTGHFYNVCPVLVSQSAIDKIPEDLRDTFFQACRDGAEAGRQMCMEANEAAIEELEAAGLEIIEIDRESLKEATASLYGEFADSLPQEMLDMVAAAEK